LLLIGLVVSMTLSNKSHLKAPDFSRSPQRLDSTLLTEPGDESSGEIRIYDSLVVAPSVEFLNLEIVLPEGMKFYTRSPFKIKVSSDHPEILAPGKFEAKLPSHHLKIPITATAGQARLTVDLLFSYCTTGDTEICYYKEVRLQIPVTVSENSDREFKVCYTVAN